MRAKELGKPLLAQLLLFFLSFPLVAKTYLVSVGISDYSAYPHGATSLRLPVNDARTIVDIYTHNTTVDYAVLLDEKATKKRIMKAMGKVFSQAKEDDIVVFFFSGHGNNYGFCAYDGTLSFADIRMAMALSPSKNKMMFVDACRSGGIRMEGPQSTQSEDSVRRSNVMLLLSSRTDENSMERPDMENGFFTEFLKKGLRGNADRDRNRIITAKELFEFVHNGVVEISFDRQHPVMWGNFDDAMPVMKW